MTNKYKTVLNSIYKLLQGKSYKYYKMATLLDKATEIVDKIITQSNEDTSRTIFAVGSKSAVRKVNLL